MKNYRCEWCLSSPLMIDYHDEEWGVPVHDDLKHFEFLILDAAQAGLSWATVLKKRENYRRAFHGFNPEKISRYGKRDFKRLMNDSGIIRNRLKVASSIDNARGFLAVRREFGSFDRYIWKFVNGRTITNKFSKMMQIPSKTTESVQMSKDLLKRGFRFVGPTICYAYMQAAGLVNDHLTRCYRHPQLRKHTF